MKKCVCVGGGGGCVYVPKVYLIRRFCCICIVIVAQVILNFTISAVSQSGTYVRTHEHMQFILHGLTGGALIHVHISLVKVM